VALRSIASLNSASTASCSASGESGIVSRLDIEGDRDRIEVGVLGDDDEADGGYIISLASNDGGLGALGENDDPG